MTITYAHLYLAGMNLFDVQSEYEEKGVTLEIHSAGESLIGIKTKENPQSDLES